MPVLVMWPSPKLPSLQASRMGLRIELEAWGMMKADLRKPLLEKKVLATPAPFVSSPQELICTGGQLEDLLAEWGSTGSEAVAAKAMILPSGLRRMLYSGHPPQVPSRSENSSIEPIGSCFRPRWPSS